MVSVGRRTLPQQHPKLTQVLVDFLSPSSFEELDTPDVALCCLGTTMRKAGSRKAFRNVDYSAVVGFAEAAHRKGARTFIHVSALSANPTSRVFYCAVKGQAEEAVARIRFESVYAFRPSMLEGEREESRPLERVGLAVMRALGPRLGKYQPTPVEALVKAMVAAAKDPAPGSHVVEADAIR
jgi:uncharacterized protein YbjT (DUF2867 family)